MKTIALALTLVAAVSAQGLGSLGGSGAAPPPAAAAGPGVGPGRQGGVAGALGGFGTPRNWGPKVYGMGVNNRFAIPPNPFKMQQALALIQNVPGALIRVDLDGEITFTNQFGQEADIIHPLGYDISELFE